MKPCVRIDRLAMKMLHTALSGTGVVVTYPSEKITIPYLKGHWIEYELSYSTNRAPNHLIQLPDASEDYLHLPGPLTGRTL